MENIDFIKFTREKNYKLIKYLIPGSTGKTVLMFDELIDEYFVCKKYETYYPEHQELFYDNFIREIKILYSLNHTNVVRVFNYYLYPKKKTGFIIMEYIKGDYISDYIKNNPNKINDLFLQTINGFMHLEECKILHRDVRPSNLLVSEDHTLKIIDFGFGKKLNNSIDNIKSVDLNWYPTITPSEFDNEIYDTRTEIFFIGKLFESLIIKNNISKFYYSEILNDMITIDYSDRINSFALIYRKILSGEFHKENFTDTQKSIYRTFANSICSIISSFDSNNNTQYINDIEYIIRKLEEVDRNSILETEIQNKKSLVATFFRGGKYFENKKSVVETKTITEFLAFIKSVPSEKQQIILNHLWIRFDKINRVSYEDDLPF